MYFLCNCFQVNAATTHWSLVNIGSGNDLVPSGNNCQQAITWVNVDLDPCRHMMSQGHKWEVIIASGKWHAAMRQQAITWISFD